MRTNRWFLIALLLFISIFALVSCRKPQGDIPLSEQDLPDLVLYNAVYTYGKPDQNPLLLQAEEISIYKDQRTKLKNVEFHQGDELSGHCESASSKDNSHVKLSGNVKLYKTTDNVKIECEDIDWDDDSQTVSTEKEVVLSYQDGTEIRAIGFTAKLDENSYIFDKIVEGTYTYDE